MALLNPNQLTALNSSLKDRAAALVARGLYVFPLQVASKKPLEGSAGFKDALTGEEALKPWDLNPQFNIGISLGPSNITVLDFDQGAENIPEWIKELRTYKVQTKNGLHVYFSGSRPTKKLYVGEKLIGDIKSQGGYVLGAGSVHPEGPLYTVVDDSPMVPLDENKIKQFIKGGDRVDVNPNSTERVARGGHDNYLNRVAGALRYTGLEEEAIYNALVEIVEKRFDDYGPDYLDMCRKHAHNIVKKPVGKDERVLFNGQPGTTKTTTEVREEFKQIEQNEKKVAAAAHPDPATLPNIKKIEHPRFPEEVMYGTSVYENFVKPIADKNSRIPYFMWFPAMQIMLNYLGTRIHVHDKDFKGSIFSVLVGRKGIIKSASVKDAINYMKAAGISAHAGTETKNAEGKSLVWTVGSPEGFGLDMYKTNCKNGILYYDELSTLVKKAGIDSSNMVGALLTLYESDKFANSIKSKKESYGLEPGTYTASVIACTTDETFAPLWSTLSGSTTGLNDRFVFIYQPENPPKMTPQIAVNTDMNAPNTRALIDKAVKQGTYSIFDPSPLARLYEIDNRYGHRAEKYALYFAVDLGRDEIDEECIERACMLVDYEIAVKDYLKTYDAVTREGSVQQEMIVLLKKNGGMMLWSKFQKKMKSMSYGASTWFKMWASLEKSGYIKKSGGLSADDPEVVYLLIDPDAD